MESSSFAAGTKLGRLIKLFSRNKFSFHTKYILRVLFLLQNGVWASVFSGIEKSRYKKKIEKYKMQHDPIFIIGHWRTGSTYLLKLMSLNSELVSPTLFDIAVPDSLLVSKKYYAPIMKRFIAPTRPMDNVKLGLDEPQEDEFALLKITNCSPLEKIAFPTNKKYFLSDYKDFAPDVKYSEQWRNELRNFYKKLVFHNCKRLLIKNPFHSMRIDTLHEMYPDAKFIHIYRHPYDVIPSTINMWDIVGKHNRLNNKWQKPTIDEVITLLDKMLIYINVKLGNKPNHQFIEIKFEEFEHNPIQALEYIYQKFQIPFSESDLQKTIEHLSQLKEYKKNRYVLTDFEKRLIDRRLAHHIKHYRYI